VTVHAPPQRAALGIDAAMPARQLAHLAGVRLAVVLWGGLAVIDVWRASGAPSYAGLGAIALLAMLSSVGMRAGTAMGCAGIAWLVVDGFVVHHAGELGWDGSADVGRLALLVGLSILATRVRR